MVESLLPDGSRVSVEPILVGRSAEKLAALGDRARMIADFTTNLDEALSDGSASIYFDAQVTSERKKSILKAHRRRQAHLHREADRRVRHEGMELVTARPRGRRDQRRRPRQALSAWPAQAEAADRLRVLRTHPFGTRGVWLLGLRGRSPPGPAAVLELPREDGGGMVLDMFPHWNYVLENLFGRVQAVTRQSGHPHPERWDEQGRSTPPPPTTPPTRSSSWRATSSPRSTPPGPFESTAASLSSSRWMALMAQQWPACSVAGSSPALRTPDAGLESRPARDRGLPRASGSRSRTMPSSQRVPGAMGAVPSPMWTPAAPHAYDLAAGVRGLQLAEAGLESSAQGRRVPIERFAS